jgi:hypothetical protein
MTDAPSFAAQRRRESQRQEWTEQTRLAEMLDEYLDPVDTFWTSLENKPLSRLSGIFQKRRGVRSGLPDVLVLWRGKPIFVELKSRAGVASKAQKKDPFGNGAGRRRLVANAKRARGADGFAFVWRGVPAALEATAAQAMGGSVCGPDAAAAAGARRGRTPTGRTTAMADASARPPDSEVGGKR